MSLLLEWTASAMLLSGSLLMLLAALGVLRMPDVYTRLSATSKAAPLGAALVLLASAITFGELAVLARALGISVFLCLTAPVSAHLLASAAQAAGITAWSGTHHDERPQALAANEQAPSRTGRVFPERPE